MKSMIKSKVNKAKTKDWAKISKNVISWYQIIYSALLIVGMVGATVLADDPDPAVAGITKITTWVANIASAIGGGVLLWGFIEWAMSLKSHDSSQKDKGLWGMAAGIVLILGPQILKNLFGSDANISPYLPSTGNGEGK